MFTTQWAHEDEGILKYESLFEKLASIVAGRPMKQTGNLRRNRITAGTETVGPHRDVNSETGEELTIVAFTGVPQEGGEFVVSLKPDEHAFIIIPSKALHEVLNVLEGERESITAVLAPVEKNDV